MHFLFYNKNFPGLGRNRAPWQRSLSVVRRTESQTEQLMENQFSTPKLASCFKLLFTQLGGGTAKQSGNFGPPLFLLVLRNVCVHVPNYKEARFD